MISTYFVFAIPIVLITLIEKILTQKHALPEKVFTYELNPQSANRQVDTNEEKSSATPAVQLDEADREFLESVTQIIEANIPNRQFGVPLLAEGMGKSARQLQRDLKRIGNFKPSRLIRNMRLQRAAQLLKQRPGEVSRVADLVGFRDVKYFSRVFKEKFGILPSQWT